MMKYTALIIGFLLQLSCASLPKGDVENYCVIGIKQQGDIHIIYISSPDASKYKIVSGRDAISGCSPLKVGSAYKLTLIRLRQDAPVINGVKLDPASPARKTCMNFKGIDICTEPEKGMYELYTASEIYADTYCDGL